MDRLQIRDIQKVQHETVLIMQGGGSLGAYECGVYKALHKLGIEFDIIAGTSIGAVNAAIIAGKLSINLFIYESRPNHEKIEDVLLCKFRYLT